MTDTNDSTGPSGAPALASLTTMRVGGAPAELVEPTSEDALVETTREAWASGEDWLLLGGGSNTVAADDGFDGTVIRVATKGVERLESPPATVRLRVQAGENWDALVAATVREGWAGIEALSGIPGSVGAAPVQNIGAYGQELGAVLRCIDFLDYASGERRRLSAADLDLGYRTSVLKRGLAGVVLAVELDLADTGGTSTPVAYEQLADTLAVGGGTRVSLAELRRAVLRLRASKGMVLDDADHDTWSAGSFFTNPIVDENLARRILPLDAPRWRLSPGPANGERDLVLPLERVDALGVAADPAMRPSIGATSQVKLSAAWLIEHSGIHRGFALPGSRAAVSGKHTLSITNRGGASAAEIVQLASFVQLRVQSEFGLALQPEPTLVGVALS